MTVLEQLRILLREYTGDSGLRIERDTVIAAGLGLDSYDLASLLGEAEERFDMTIPDRVVLGMLTVGDMADYIEKHTKS